MKRRALWVTVLAGLLMVTSTTAALASEETEADAPTLDEVKARVIEKIENRIAGFEEIIEKLEGETGIAAEQRSALAADGIAAFEDALVEVEAATSVREVMKALRDAQKEYREHRRVRTLYVHIHGDLVKFGRQLERLDKAIDRAEEAGADVTAAEAESAAAAEDLATAADLLDAIDPSQTGQEVVEALKEAHRTAHAGKAHIRAGWKALFEALPPE